MPIKVNRNIAITDSLEGKVNGGTINGNATFNGLYYNRTFNVTPSSTLTYRLNTNEGNYFTGEITTGHPGIKFSATYNANASGSSLIALPGNIGIGDRIILLCSSSTVTGVSAVDIQDVQYGLVFNKNSSLGLASGTNIDTYRKLLVANHSSGDIFILMIVKNHDPSAGGFSITSATGTTGMPDALTINASSTLNIELAFGRINQTGFTPTAPTGMTMVGWFASSTHTFMAAYKNNTRNSSFDPPAFGGTGSATWEARSTSIIGPYSYTSSNPIISIFGAGSCIFDFTYINGTPIWDSDILWPNNTGPTITGPGLIFFQKALNNNWLAVHYPR